MTLVIDIGRYSHYTHWLFLALVIDIGYSHYTLVIPNLYPSSLSRLSVSWVQCLKTSEVPVLASLTDQ